uniref:Uncharacterized protein n=1 Tax=Romanomermis culicivorax TaxID=13658 RepID=A0A915KH22_ROMCU
MSNKPAAVLLQELQSLKTQETALSQILQKCTGCMNKLKVEELHLKSILREESAAESLSAAATVTSNGVTSQTQGPATSTNEPYENGVDSQNFLANNNHDVNFAPFAFHMK